MPLKLLDYQGLETLAEFINKNTSDISELGTDFQSLAQLVASTVSEINEKLDQIDTLENKVNELESIIEQLKNTGARYNSSIVYNS